MQVWQMSYKTRFKDDINNYKKVMGINKDNPHVSGLRNFKGSGQRFFNLKIETQILVFSMPQPLLKKEEHCY